MDKITVSIAEGKKGFSRLISKAGEAGEDVIVTKRGKPVAVIVSYDDYQTAARMEGLRKIRVARLTFGRAGIRAADVHKESRSELTRRG